MRIEAAQEKLVSALLAETSAIADCNIAIREIFGAFAECSEEALPEEPNLPEGQTQARRAWDLFPRSMASCAAIEEAVNPFLAACRRDGAGDHAETVLNRFRKYFHRLNRDGGIAVADEDGFIRYSQKGGIVRLMAVAELPQKGSRTTTRRRNAPAGTINELAEAASSLNPQEQLVLLGKLFKELPAKEREQFLSETLKGLGMTAQPSTKPVRKRKAS